MKEDAGNRLGDCKSEGIFLNDIVGEEVKQECLRANSTRTEVGYYIGRVVTPHFSGQLRPGPTVALRGHVEPTSCHREGIYPWPPIVH